MQVWKTIRIFISSTFRDMHAELVFIIRFVFPELKERCAKRQLHLIDVDLRWGVTEAEAKQGKVIEICLDEIERCRPFFIGLLGERYGWTPEKFEVSDDEKFKWLTEFQGHSVTALEIHHGVLRDEEMKTRAFFYFRDAAFLKDVPEKERADFLAESDDAAQKLKVLKKEIKAKCPVFENYPCAYDGLDENGKVKLTRLEDFGNRILDDLWTAICLEHPADALQPDDLAIERAFHETFIENRTEHFITDRFIGRRDVLDKLREFVENEEDNSLVVTGTAGCGKSAVLAKFAREYSEQHTDYFVLTHFIGASPGSTDVRRTLLRLCRELKRKFAIKEEISTDYYELRQAFVKFLEQTVERGKVLLVIGALNQLDESYFAHQLDWLPSPLPKGLKLIVSTLKGDCLDALRRRNPQPREVLVGSLTAEERREIVTKTLQTYRKTLDENQMRLLLRKKESYNPLYLVVACEELRVSGDFDTISVKLKSLAEQVETLFGQVLERVEHDHGKELVADALTLLECSCYGLLENEMLELLARNGEKQLPQTVWARFYRSLKFYLRPSGSDENQSGEGLLDFFHRQLSKAVRQRYLTDEETEIATHQRLANYFQHKADPSNDKIWTGNYPRGLSELAHHQLAGKLYEDLFQTARDETFLQAQANAFIEEPAIQLNTLQRALTVAGQIDDAAKMAEFMLRHAQRIIKLAEISPLNALCAGRLEQALNLADLIFSRDKERGVLWFLLLAWHLKWQDRNEEARKILSDLAAKDLPRLASDDLAALALCQLYEVDESSFLVAQEKLLHGKGRLKLCQNLLAIYKRQEIKNERIINLVFQKKLAKNEESITSYDEVIDIILYQNPAQAKALSEIAKAQAETGKFEEIFQTKREINDVNDLGEIAKAQAIAGKDEEAMRIFEEALKTKGEINDEYYRADALSEIVKAQVIAGRFEKAIKIAREISDADKRADALGKTAKAQATSGKFEDALKTAREINYEFYQAYTLSAIVKAQVMTGKVEEAIKTAKEISYDSDKQKEVLSEIAKAQATSGKFEEALETARQIKDKRRQADALSEIAKAQAIAEKGEEAMKTFEEALKTAKEINHPFSQGDALREIVQAQAIVGRVEAALKTTREIKDESWRAYTLSEIAKAQATSGKFEEAMKTFEEALKNAKEINHPYTQINALRYIAQAQATVGRVEEAMKTFLEALKMTKEINSESSRADALREIAKALGVAGKFEEAEMVFEGALKTARHISNEGWRASALSKIANDLGEIAKAQVAIRKNGMANDWAKKRVEELLMVTRERDDKYWQGDDLIYHLTEIAETQVKAGFVEDAENTFEEALKVARGINDGIRRIEHLGLIVETQEIAKAQAATRKDEVAKKTFEELLMTAKEINKERSREDVLREIAKAQAVVGKDEEAIKTIKLILVRSEFAISQVAEVFASNGAKYSFKQLLAPASYHLSASYKMCGLLARLYADDEDAIDKIAALVRS